MTAWNPWLQGLQPVQSLQDIQSLIEAEVPEGQHLEYKRDLPGGAKSMGLREGERPEAAATPPRVHTGRGLGVRTPAGP